MKSFIFAALFLNLIALYLSKNLSTDQNPGKDRFSFFASIVAIVMMVILMIDSFINPKSLISSYVSVIILLVLVALAFEIIGLLKKNLPMQLIAASIFIFLIYPTIFTYALYFLFASILILIVFMWMFYKEKERFK